MRGSCGVTFAERNVIASERITNVLRLERIHRLTDGRGAAWHGGDEPFAFVMAAEETVELRLVARLAHEQQQMTLLRFALQHGNIQRFAQVRGHAEFEELALRPSRRMSTA